MVRASSTKPGWETPSSVVRTVPPWTNRRWTRPACSGPLSPPLVRECSVLHQPMAHSPAVVGPASVSLPGLSTCESALRDATGSRYPGPPVGARHHMGIRQSCSDRQARTPVPHVVTAVAITLLSSDAALMLEPRGTTRRSRVSHLTLAPVVPGRIGA
jgi:hypothetical protein